jgi:putative methyltransferase
VAQDWLDWHAPYDDPGSHLQRRLEIVQRRLREGIDQAPPGELRLISMCAGQGRDVIGVLAGHERQDDVTARLVELDERNVEWARGAIAMTGLDRVEVVVADAGRIDAYAGAVPADLVLVCGVFGNIADDDIARTVRLLPSLCREGATVLWTRHRLEPDLTPTIRDWFTAAGFTEVGFETVDGFFFGVGAARWPRATPPAPAEERLFTFVGHDALRPDPWPPTPG